MSKKVAPKFIRLRGVQHNNLKNFDLDLPIGKLIVVTGLSGSGKSSLAFDTLFAEGQRRYIETFSPYARQFFDRMDKPQVDSIEGIPPAIAIEQRNAVKTTRSTVGTMTEICDYAKVIWANLAQLYCRKCGEPVRKDSPQSIWENVKSSLVGTSRCDVPARAAAGGTGIVLESTEQKIAPLNAAQTAETRTIKSTNRCAVAPAVPTLETFITFNVPLSEKISLEESLALISKQGYQRLLVEGEFLRVENAASHFTKAKPTSLTVIQDRLKLAPESRARFIEACEAAYHFGKGKLTLHFIEVDSDNSKLKAQSSKLFSNRFHCAACDIDYREPTPALFSFNHPLGACPTCKGFGRTITIDYNLAIPDRSKTLAGGAVKPWQSGQSAECQDDLKKFCKIRRVPMDVPFEKLSKEHQQWVIEGDPGYGQNGVEWPKAWYGVKGYFRWLESKSYKMHVRVLLSRYRSYTTCPTCNGARFQPDTLLYKISILESPQKTGGTEASSPSLPSDGGEGRGEEVRNFLGNPSPQSSPHSFLAGRGGNQDAQSSSSVSLTLADFYQLSLKDALHFTETLEASRKSSKVSDPLTLALNEVRSRLGYLNEVGLGYLTLDRATRSLSGGETERVNLTTCLGSGLVNTLFILDEPSVGLHPRDTDQLVKIVTRLRDAGNTVIVVEHEPSVMRAADQIVDIGPGHGESGGKIVFQGSFAEILKSKESLTGKYLSGKVQVEVPPRRQFRSSFLTLAGASLHNLKNVTLEIPLEKFVCVTGVSGSGKTTLIRECLMPALEAKLRTHAAEALASNVKSSLKTEKPSENENDDEDDKKSAIGNGQSPIQLHGWENIGRVLLVDQSAIGKTPRSNPAVYIGAFDDIRELFAQVELAKQRGLGASAFSFNSSQGQCEKCRGAGFEKIEMQFLSDIFIRCPVCNGRRYREHILEVKLCRSRREEAHSQLKSRKNQSLLTSAATKKDWSIADLLEASVDEVISFLESFSENRHAQRALEKIKLLQEVGLGYLRLGQPINTLSGGESQRLKLVSHLAEFQTAIPLAENVKPSLFLFDEPTTGLHFEDVRILLKVFQRLVDASHSVLVIEHNLELIKCADWIIDLGPEAGDAGGQIVAIGAPEEIVKCASSHTGRALKTTLHLDKAP